ncbi:MAG: hypothetical protein J0H17_10155 [Rhizobiales bacterium]|nr:hypothetical protein [Hyphomicrobiales bacterium]
MSTRAGKQALLTVFERAQAIGKNVLIDLLDAQALISASILLPYDAFDGSGARDCVVGG